MSETCSIGERSGELAGQGRKSNARRQSRVPPKVVVIYDQERRKIEGVIGPYRLGSMLQLTCESIGGEPDPLLTWTGTRLTVKESSYPNIFVNGSTLTISSLAREDQWSHYTCTAWNSNLSMPLHATVTIELI
ncbi:MAM domain-containing glycosylphosphatidylinositol anchor protein 2-like, partial [Stegodyphus dumicola]|uniref:MAM domain-containing glycosylphosphatidylinositol anchor protein 2-like n=1 Tax=Stegodyphus dumicola TaxID=202533 RepID=UPI0015ADE26E